MMNAQTIRIDGKDYPIKIKYRHQRYSIEHTPSEEEKAGNPLAAHDYTLDLLLQILAEPKPFKDREQLIDALNPEEFRKIDKDIIPLIFGWTDEETALMKDSMGGAETKPGKR